MDKYKIEKEDIRPINNQAPQCDNSGNCKSCEESESECELLEMLPEQKLSAALALNKLLRCAIQQIAQDNVFPSENFVMGVHNLELLVEDRINYNK